MSVSPFFRFVLQASVVGLLATVAGPSFGQDNPNFGGSVPTGVPSTDTFSLDQTIVEVGEVAANPAGTKIAYAFRRDGSDTWGIAVNLWREELEFDSIDSIRYLPKTGQFLYRASREGEILIMRTPSPAEYFGFKNGWRHLGENASGVLDVVEIATDLEFQSNRYQYPLTLCTELRSLWIRNLDIEMESDDRPASTVLCGLDHWLKYFPELEFLHIGPRFQIPGPLKPTPQEIPRRRNLDSEGVPFAPDLEPEPNYYPVRIGVLGPNQLLRPFTSAAERFAPKPRFSSAQIREALTGANLLRVPPAWDATEFGSEEQSMDWLFERSVKADGNPPRPDELPMWEGNAWALRQLLTRNPLPHLKALHLNGVPYWIFELRKPSKIDYSDPSRAFWENRWFKLAPDSNLKLHSDWSLSELSLCSCEIQVLDLSQMAEQSGDRGLRVLSLQGSRIEKIIMPPGGIPSLRVVDLRRSAVSVQVVRTLRAHPGLEMFLDDEIEDLDAPAWMPPKRKGK